MLNRVNLPNQITLLRLALAIVFFFVLTFFSANELDKTRWLLVVAFWIFLVAAVTDVIDGALARAMKQVTSFGRILDPVVDKVIVCGAYIMFAGTSFYNSEQNGSLVYVAPWMAILILGRELAVSAIRAHAESSGVDFSADWGGKLKMLVQSVTVLLILAAYGYHESFEQLQPVAHVMVWVTVVVTALSVVTYIRRGWQFLFSSAALGQKTSAAPTAPAKERQ